MELFFTNEINVNQSEAEFDSFESQHILKTMRKGDGDLIHFTDGKGRLFEGKIFETKPILKVHCKLLKQIPWPPPFLSILGIGFIRPSRMDFLIEKATELGIHKFYFYKSRYTNYYSENKKRFEKITRQAIKQSNRLYLPEICIMADFSEFLEAVSHVKHKFIADQTASESLMDFVQKVHWQVDENIIFIIGPEGGLDNEEIKRAKEYNFLAVSFGEYRLRTETAAISAASYINLIGN